MSLAAEMRRSAMADAIHGYAVVVRDYDLKGVGAVVDRALAFIDNELEDLSRGGEGQPASEARGGVGDTEGGGENSEEVPGPILHALRSRA